MSTTDYLIGLDFGTSQTKVCLLNKNNNLREFLKFGDNKYFLPSLITKKNNGTFSYGNEDDVGEKFRYFKMAAAEDEELLQTTHEDIDGKLEDDNIDNYRKYAEKVDINAETLVVLYLSYVYLYIKKKKETKKVSPLGGLLGRLATTNHDSKFTYSVNLGIPTEWNNPDHIKRKTKFQSLLITSVILANQFKDIEQFVSEECSDLLQKIAKINTDHLSELENMDGIQRKQVINSWLDQYNLSVFPESAAGINYLLKTKRLENGAYATMDIGAGTSDLAIFEVRNHVLSRYYCAESASIASNDFYREYAKQLNNRESVTYNEIKNAENLIRRHRDEVEENYLREAIRIVKGNLGQQGLEFLIRKTFYRKYYINLFHQDRQRARASIDILDESPIIVLGGGANLEGLSEGTYCFFKGANPFGNFDKNFNAKEITDYVQQVDIHDPDNEIGDHINLLILALGLTYSEQNSNFIPFYLPQDQPDEVNRPLLDTDRYFYYDLQEAAYK